MRKSAHEIFVLLVSIGFVIYHVCLPVYAFLPSLRGAFGASGAGPALDFRGRHPRQIQGPLGLGLGLGVGLDLYLRLCVPRLFQHNRTVRLRRGVVAGGHGPGPDRSDSGDGPAGGAARFAHHRRVVFALRPVRPPAARNLQPPRIQPGNDRLLFVPHHRRVVGSAFGGQLQHHRHLRVFGSLHRKHRRRRWLHENVGAPGRPLPGRSGQGFHHLLGPVRLHLGLGQRQRGLHRLLHHTHDAAAGLQTPVGRGGGGGGLHRWPDHASHHGGPAPLSCPNWSRFPIWRWPPRPFYSPCFTSRRWAWASIFTPARSATPAWTKTRSRAGGPRSKPAFSF